MGGTPTIQGGMTKAEQEQLLMEERRYQEEQEMKRREMAKTEEAQREEAAKLERDRIKAEELARITEANMAEEEAISAAQAAEERDMTNPDKMKVDFYGSLYSGVGQRPTTRSEVRPQ